MLRGAQTPGELKQRSERLHSFADLGAVQETLERLVEREQVARHPRRPGQKEERYEQLLGGTMRPAPSRTPPRSPPMRPPRPADSLPTAADDGRRASAAPRRPAQPPRSRARRAPTTGCGAPRGARRVVMQDTAPLTGRKSPARGRLLKFRSGRWITAAGIAAHERRNLPRLRDRSLGAASVFGNWDLERKREDSERCKQVTGGRHRR